MLFDAHWHAFRVFGGVPGRGIYDNMKTAVDRVGCGKQRDVNARFRVSVKFVNDMVILKRETGGLEPRAQGNGGGHGKLGRLRGWMPSLI